MAVYIYATLADFQQTGLPSTATSGVSDDTISTALENASYMVSDSFSSQFKLPMLVVGPSVKQHTINIAAMLILEVQHRDRAGAHDAAGDEGRAGHNQRVERIAVGRQRVRHEAIVGGIAHRRVQDTIDEQGARRLVEFIFHRLAAGRHFDNHIEAVQIGRAHV